MLRVQVFFGSSNLVISELNIKTAGIILTVYIITSRVSSLLKWKCWKREKWLHVCLFIAVSIDGMSQDLVISLDHVDFYFVDHWCPVMALQGCYHLFTCSNTSDSVFAWPLQVLFKSCRSLLSHNHPSIHSFIWQWEEPGKGLICKVHTESWSEYFCLYSFSQPIFSCFRFFFSYLSLFWNKIFLCTEHL